ncbi:MAG: hypothetical protein AB1656_22555 [Candidatus Omnitrophota bacterium]
MNPGLILCSLWIFAAQSPIVINPLVEEPGKIPWKGSYRSSEEFPIPKTLLFWTIDPESLEKNAAEYVRIGFNGIIAGGIQNDWSDDVWARDGKPYTIGEQDELLQTWKRVNDNCRQKGLDSNFLKVAYYQKLPDWFNDPAWDIYRDRLKQAAIFAKQAGFRGVAVDTEYVGEQYNYNWAGYSYDRYNRKDLIEKVRQRMRDSMSDMLDAFPDMEFITFPGGDHEIIVDILKAWIEEAARRDASGGVHLFTEWTYLRDNPNSILLHAQTLHRQIKRLVSPKAWDYWRRRCSVGPAGWPIGKEVPSQRPELQAAQFTPDEFRSQFAGLLAAGRRYIWIYPHAVDYLPDNNAQLASQPDSNQYKIAYVPNLNEYIQVLRQRLIPDDDLLLKNALRIREGDVSDRTDRLGISALLCLAGPNFQFRTIQVEQRDKQRASDDFISQTIQRLQIERWRGEADPDIRSLFGVQTEWNLIGPFENKEGKGFDAVYPPEKEIDLKAKVVGADGEAAWEIWNCDDLCGAVDLKSHFKTNQWVCAYALGYLTVDAETSVQIRVGVNDAMKMWIGGDLVFVKPPDSLAILDNWAIPVTLKAGTTPVLLKICNEEKDWGFYFRVTDEQGKTNGKVKFSL